MAVGRLDRSAVRYVKRHFVHVHVERATQRPVDIPLRTREALRALA